MVHIKFKRGLSYLALFSMSFNAVLPTFADLATLRISAEDGKYISQFRNESVAAKKWNDIKLDEVKNIKLDFLNEMILPLDTCYKFDIASFGKGYIFKIPASRFRCRIFL